MVERREDGASQPRVLFEPTLEREASSQRARTKLGLQRLLSATLAGGFLVLAGSRLHEPATPQVAPHPAAPAASAPAPAPAPAPRSVPDALVVPSEVFAPEADGALDDAQVTQRLAAALSASGRVRDAAKLVGALETAATYEAHPPPLPLAIALAATETHGRVLAVSPAAAVGLGQAMLVEAVRDGMSPLQVTADDLEGHLAYVAKKPYGDALAVVRALVAPHPPVDAEQRAVAQIEAALSARGEGLADLQVLSTVADQAYHDPDAPARYLRRAEEADARGTEVLHELERLLSGPHTARDLLRFAADTRGTYAAYFARQRLAWGNVEARLTRQRNIIIRRLHPRLTLKQALATHQYEDGEVLGEELDARFSPSRSSQFVLHHLQRKLGQAKPLARDHDDVLHVAAKLYNAGQGGIVRYEAGLSRATEMVDYERRVFRFHAELVAVLDVHWTAP